MPEIKITPQKLADALFMRATGWSDKEIAEELDVSLRTVQRHVSEIRKRAEEIGPQLAVLEVVTRAGPAYGIFRLFPLRMTPDEIIKNLKGE